MALCAAVTADPAVIISGGYLESPLTSAALIAPAAPLASVQSLAPIAAVGSIPAIAPVAPVAPVAPLAPVAPVTSYLSDYRYAYGSGYSYQDTYPVVNSALSLPYSLPYAYAADWFYRK